MHGPRSLRREGPREATPRTRASVPATPRKGTLSRGPRRVWPRLCRRPAQPSTSGVFMPRRKTTPQSVPRGHSGHQAPAPAVSCGDPQLTFAPGGPVSPGSSLVGVNDATHLQPGGQGFESGKSPCGPFPHHAHNDFMLWARRLMQAGPGQVRPGSSQDWPGSCCRGSGMELDFVGPATVGNEPQCKHGG